MAHMVNRHGAVHSVADAETEALLARGFRPATDEEVAAWYAGQGMTFDPATATYVPTVNSWDDAIAEWTPKPKTKRTRRKG
jgi:hypothetical protein